MIVTVEQLLAEGALQYAIQNGLKVHKPMPSNTPHEKLRIVLNELPPHSSVEVVSDALRRYPTREWIQTFHLYTSLLFDASSSVEGPYLVWEGK